MTLPPYKGGDNLPLDKLDEYQFQSFSCELLALEPNIVTCRVYGTRGYRQFGVDVVGYYGAPGMEVGQCKRYRKFTIPNLKTASDEFLDCWKNHWKGKGVRRFVLLLACDIEDPNVEDAIRTQRARFRKHNIRYDVWSATDISRKAIGQRSLIERFFPSLGSWADLFCGLASAHESPLALSILSHHLEEASAALSSEIDNTLERIRAELREGNRIHVASELKRLRTDPDRWSLLSPRTRAKAIRLEASLALDQEADRERAARLAEEAKILDPGGNDIRLRIKIALLTQGPAVALSIVPDAHDLETHHLKASLLLILGQHEDCAAILAKAETLSAADSETFRLNALLHAVRGQLERARLEIKKACEQQPKWEINRSTAATIDYLSSLSPACNRHPLAAWPEPVSAVLVNYDQESLDRLAHAASTFRELALQPGLPPKEARILQTWHLACLANHPETQREAESYCRSLTDANAGHSQAISWAVVKGYDIDFNRCAGALREQLNQGGASLHEILALSACFLITDKIAEAIAVLDETRPQFERQSQMDAWHHWRVQALVRQGNADEALQVLQALQMPAPLRFAETNVRRALAERTGDIKPFINHLDQSYRDSRDVLFLVDACDFMASRGEWSFVAERASQLIGVGTPEPLVLAAYSYYHTGQYRECLKTINDGGRLFLRGRLPIRIRRLRAACLDALGAVPEALSEAEEIAREDDSTLNLLSIARLYFQYGSFERLCATVQQLSGRADLRSLDCLELASSVRHRDRSLARSLWERANQIGVADEAVLRAIDLGFVLGLDSQLRALTERAVRLTHEGKINARLLSTADMVEAQQGYLSSIEKASAGYAAGIIPVHMLADRLGAALADLYSPDLDQATARYDPLHAACLLVFHGSRSAGSDLGTGVRLNLEISAVLLLDELNLLPIVERAFAPIRISRYVIGALTWMEQRLLPNQPARQAAQAQILELLAAHEITEATTAIKPDAPQRAVSPEMDLPLRQAFQARSDAIIQFTEELVSPGPEQSRVQLNCRATVDDLRQRGLLSQEQVTAALEALGNEGQRAPVGNLPRHGEAILCIGTIPVLLAQAGILRILCRNFAVQIDPALRAQLRGEQNEHRRREPLIQRLRSLSNRLSGGLATGTYNVFPQHPPEDSTGDTEPWQTPTIACLADWLQFPCDTKDLVWADDRFLNGHRQRAGNVRIISLLDVLATVVARGALTKEQAYAVRHRLRLANCRFISVDSDEIHYLLQQAAVQRREIVESQELRTLRQYMAACLARLDLLQMPVAGPNSDREEFAFILGYGRHVRDALVGLWADEVLSEEQRRTRAEWIISALYIDLAGLKAGIALVPPEIGMHVSALDIIELIAQGIARLPSPLGDRHSSRRRFLEWIEFRLLIPRARANPGLVEAAADYVKRLFQKITKSDSAQEHRVGIMLNLQAILDDIPPSLRRVLDEDSAFLQSIGILKTTVFNVGDLAFTLEEYAKAAAEAIQGRDFSIRTSDRKMLLRFKPAPDKLDQPTVIVEPETGEPIRVVDDLLNLLLPSTADRERVLRSHREWFDTGAEEFDRRVAEIASLEDPALRLEKGFEARNLSASVYYRVLAERVRRREDLVEADLLPSDLRSLLRHYRIPEGFQDSGLEFRIENGGQELMSTEGLDEAIGRFAHLPLPLPAALLTAVSALSVGERRQLIKRLLRSPVSPLSVLHIVRLIALGANSEISFRRLARRIISRVTNETGTDERKAFLKLVGWALGKMDQSIDVVSWSHELRLIMAWAHASRVYATFTYYGATPAWLDEVFKAPAVGESLVTLEGDWIRRGEVLHPSNVSPESFVVTGLGYALTGSAEDFFSDRLRDRLAGCVMVPAGGDLVPLPGLWRDMSVLRNESGSFLGRDALDDFTMLLGNERARGYNSGWRRNVVDTAVRELSGNIRDTNSWVAILGVFGGTPLSGDAASKIDDVLAGANLRDLFEADPESCRFILKAASVRIQYLQNDTVRRKMGGQLLDVVDVLADAVKLRELRSAFGEDDPVILTLNLFLSIAYPRSGEAQRRDEFVKLAIELSERCPALRNPMRVIFERLCLESPVSQAVHFWPALTRLRALPES